MNWQQHTALLTGASGGIGQAIARELANKGMNLILQGRNLQALTQLQRNLPGEHIVLQADLSCPLGREQLLREVRHFEHLSMLINNAGVHHFGLCQQQNQGDIDTLLQLNLQAPICLSQALLPQLQQSPEAYIVNIGSAFGHIGFAGQSLYCASKFGLRGFTESLQRELQDSNVQVQYLAPRATQTSMNSHAAQALNQQLGNAVDTPQTVAKALVQLLQSRRRRRVLGFPEALFARLNGLLPELLDQALSKQLRTIKAFANPNTAPKELLP